jgi:hypothetical protein
VESHADPKNPATSFSSSIASTIGPSCDVRGIERPLRRVGTLPGVIVPVLRAGRTMKVNDDV